MKRLLTVALACFVTAMTVWGAYAQQPVNPCKEDISKFCSHLRAGNGAIAECLSQHESELSPMCKTVHLEELAKVLKNTEQVCQADSTKFCGAELQQQGIPLFKCLRLNQTGLSPECRTQLFEALELMHY